MLFGLVDDCSRMFIIKTLLSRLVENVQNVLSLVTCDICDHLWQPLLKHF